MKSYTEFALQTAKAAGRLILQSNSRMRTQEYVSRTNFRTPVDLQSDAFIRRVISKRFPTHNIYSEEHRDRNNQSEYSWVIDPLDGTIPYTYGTSDHFSVCIALVKEKTPILGVIYAPVRGEVYLAEQGRGATCNDMPISVSSGSDIHKALVAIDYGKLDRPRVLKYQKKLLAQEGVTYTVSLACASMELALVASGKLQAHMALQLDPWDMAAGVVLIREAGGKVTTIAGKEWQLGDGSILAANPPLHAKLLKYFVKKP